MKAHFNPRPQRTHRSDELPRVPLPRLRARSSSLLRFLFTLALTALLPALLLAHEGPEHEIDELNERIAKDGETGELLLQRAIEYLVIRKNKEAVDDLERAIQLAPESAPIMHELGYAYFVSGKTNEALRVVSRGIDGDATGAERAALLMVRAEVLRARKERKDALKDANEAIKVHPNNVEWYLFRSQLQRALKLTKERVRGLEDGMRVTGSGVLMREWIDALIDDGQHAAALEKVEAELNSSRLQSSWLIRRARIRLATDQKDAAKADLEAALKELNARMTSSAPDPSLLADRGLVRDLLGDKDGARRDYRRARDKGFTEDWLLDRIRELRD